MNKWWVTGAVALLTVVGALYLVNSSSSKNQNGAAAGDSRLPGLLVGNAPWPENQDKLSDRLRVIGLPALPRESTVFHLHQHIDITIDGKPVAIPADIGIDANGQFIAPIHTHDASAIIHVESPTEERFTLGDFFDVWGVRFSNDCLGGYCRDANHLLNVYSNGKLVSGNVRDLELTEHQELAVAYGLVTELTNPATSTFAFPAGY
ncbi:MAG: hypothetical protein PHI63_05030 [Patescibacteria group bacterium]|nr:hypothetical protein [Patescibacteria group bacterium]